MKVVSKNGFLRVFQVALLLIGAGCSTDGNKVSPKPITSQPERQSALSSAPHSVPSSEPSPDPRPSVSPSPNPESSELGCSENDPVSSVYVREYLRSHPNSLLSGLFPLHSYSTSLGLSSLRSGDHRSGARSEKLPSSPVGSEGGFGLPSVIQRPVSGEEQVRIEFLRHEIEFRIEQLTKNYGQAFSESAGVPVRWYTTGRLASGQERFEALLNSIQEADEVKALEEILDGALEFDHLHSEDRARFIQDLTFLFVAQAFESEDAQSRYLSLL